MCVVMMCSWFAPTNLVITFETKGLGKFTPEELRDLVEKDSKGNVSLNLPAKSVLIANHQVKSVFAHLVRSSDARMTTETIDICGLVVSLRPRFPLSPCFAVFKRQLSPRYAWCLTYFMNTHRDVYIVLKKSLKWVPVVGWVCEKSVSSLGSLAPMAERHSASKNPN